MDAALYALLGVVVGAVASFGGTFLQQRQQDHRDRLRMAVDIALKEYQQDWEIARATPGGAYIRPVENYVEYHARMLDAIAKGKLTSLGPQDLQTDRAQNPLGKYTHP